jgi:hypothetical protein
MIGGKKEDLIGETFTIIVVMITVLRHIEIA